MLKVKMLKSEELVPVWEVSNPGILAGIDTIPSEPVSVDSGAIPGHVPIFYPFGALHQPMENPSPR